MKRNKKLIALICAMAMILSLFTGLTVVNAEGEGMVLEYDAAASTSTKTVVNVVAKGFTEVGSFTVNIDLPENITAAVGKNPIIVGEENFADHAYGYSAAAVSNVAVPSNGVILTIEMTGTVSEEFNIKLGGKSAISDGTTKLAIARNNLTIEEETIPVWSDPSATPTPTPEAPVSTKAPKITPVPAATEDPDASAAPTKAPVEVTQGMKLEYNESASSATTAVVDVIAVGFTEIGSFTVNLALPEEVTAAVGKNPIITGEENFADHQYGYSAAAVSNVAVPADGKILTIEMTGVTKDFVTELTGKSAISDGTNKLALARNNLPVAWTTVKAYSSGGDEPEATPTPIPQKAETVAAKDLVDASKITGETKDAEGDSNFRLGIKVTDKDGNDVTDTKYGADDGYVATITDKNGNDVELTKDEFSNLVNGYISALPEDLGVTSVADAIGKLKFKPYNTGMNFTAQIIDAANNVVDSGEESPKDIGGGTKPTAAPTMSIAVTSGGKAVTSVEVKSIVTVTVNVPAAVQVEGAKLDKDLVLDHADYLELIASTVNDNTAEYKYQAVKAGNVKITANYVKETVKTAAEDTTTTTTKETVASANTSLKITAAKSTGGGSSSSGSSSTSSGGGAIASGLVDSGSGYLPGIGFSDMADADWATEAVNALAARKIVSGVGDNNFDPNGQLTRAAYAQMLVNAIGHAQDSADTEFNDVPTDAWFYHNVAVAAQLGIVSGYGDGNFGPYDLITREQMALMTQKAAVVMSKSLVGADAGTFTDDADIADWSRDAVYTLANAGIINGMGDGTFAPKANATRAQAAVIIYNTFVK